MIRSSSQNPFFNPTDHVRKTESLTPLVLARSQGAAHPDQLASTLSTKKPHIVRALFDRQNYKDDLNKFKRERPEKHYQRLLNELRVQNPDPQAIKRHFKKLSSCGQRSTPSYAAPIPPSEQGRLAMVKDCEVLRESIDKALVYFSPASATTDFLTHLKVQLGNQVVRIDEVLAREEQLYAAYARMASDLKREHGQAAMMSEQGTEGAVFLGTKLRRDTCTAGNARSSPRTETPETSAQDDASDNVMEDATAAPEQTQPAPKPSLSPRRAPGGSHQGFVGALPTKKAVKYQTVFKAVEDPNAVKGAVAVHDRVAYLQRRAGQPLPFDVPCHVLVQPDQPLRDKLTTQLERTKTTQERQQHLERQKSALKKQPVLLQEFLPGSVVFDLAFDDRKAMVSDPEACRKAAASLVVGPMVGLTDHLAIDGMGFNNWTNVISPDGKHFDMIDLTPQNKDIAQAAKTSLKQLVHDLRQLAHHVGRDRTLPSDWFEYMKTSISDFWQVTYTADGGLFSLKDFMSPAEQQQEQQLSAALAALPVDAAQERNALKAQIKTLRESADQRARDTLRPLRQQAAPWVLAGLVDGLRWLERNASTLLEAHSTTAKGADTWPALIENDMHEITDILAGLKPSERKLLSSLKPPAPVQTSLLKA